MQWPEQIVTGPDQGVQLAMAAPPALPHSRSYIS
jgi:hypothetical protein